LRELGGEKEEYGKRLGPTRRGKLRREKTTHVVVEIRLRKRKNGWTTAWPHGRKRSQLEGEK